MHHSVVAYIVFETVSPTYKCIYHTHVKPGFHPIQRTQRSVRKAANAANATHETARIDNASILALWILRRLRLLRQKVRNRVALRALRWMAAA